MRIRIHPAFALYLLSMAVFSSWQMTLCAMGALLVHEAGHYAAARLPVSYTHLTLPTTSRV